jgi:hypothetical protein
MPTLLIEHSISDFDLWHDAFMRFAARRKEGGVIRERIMQPVDDPHHVLMTSSSSLWRRREASGSSSRRRCGRHQPTRPLSWAVREHASRR